MELQQNANIITAEGKDAGSLHMVVIDPETYKVTHIVIKSGLIIKDDKVVPVSNITATDRSKVTLNCSVDELKEMSPLKIEVPVSNDSANLGEGYVPVSGGMPIAPPTIMETKRTIPEELVALKEGAQVTSADNKHVGNVECVLTEPETFQVARLIVSQGLLTKTRKTIPIQWVKMLSDEKVQLSVEASEFEEHPPDPEQPEA